MGAQRPVAPHLREAAAPAISDELSAVGLDAAVYLANRLTDGERAADSLREQAANVAARASRNRHITSYNPIGVDRSYGGDDERQHLGRAALPLRPMKKAPPQEEPEGGV